MNEIKPEQLEVEMQTLHTDDSSLVGDGMSSAPAAIPSMQPAEQRTASSMMPGQDQAKKKLLIIGGVVVAGIVMGVGAFFIWRATHVQPTPEMVSQSGMPVATPVEPVATTTIAATTTAQMPAPDDITVIEQDLNRFNVQGIDAETNTALDMLNKAL